MAMEHRVDPLFQPLSKKGQANVISRPSLSNGQQVIRKLAKNKLAMLGLFIITALVAMAIIGPNLVPYSYSDQSLLTKNQEVSSEHWFGTDELGRDMFARTWYGARISLTIGVVAALIDLVIGVTVGGIAGYMAGRGKRGDRIDTIIMRVIEVLYGLPYLLVVILLMVVMEPGILTIIIALSATGWVGMARLVRGQILQLKNQEFILAAQVLGAKFNRILLKHLIPNTFGVIIVNLTFTIPSAIFAESFLSFLGLGVQAPVASWGTMTNDALGVILTGDWWRLFFPALMISLTMFAFNVFGDGLQDALDPRLRD
ncbi:ABC transporter permease [Brevibacillus sp. FSL K6-0770]|uniref:Dipeptide transport system permease protein DppC n=3 Tax=Bacteria TaxID=2 RepID=A0A4Y3PVJ3_BREPA|nr:MULTISPECIES: ABC transporter permease [Brevibacillus]MDH6348680.1 peptide/nickel transport system permease protein [Brevibacillus sp. 1238]MDR5002177.1 ABC transporter permease [Brevibacillus parabrevis]MED2256235.1 ABC transporter permease [Brevibacillus parabrevis]RNB96993.1 ABC transporter permease [Brevibacillus parabrevis]WDV97026.1 ABC transporter permease [Brevibacillus parabrevis]